MERIYFFSTPNDIVPVLKRFEANSPLKFVALGNFSSPNIPIYLHSSEIPEPGIATHETGNASAAFLVSLRESENHMRKFTTNEGETIWSLNNGDNEHTIVLTMAGLWTDGTLLSGVVDTLHETSTAQQLMKWFLSALKKEGFSKIRRWWVGKEAMSMLKDGRRLATAAVQSPPEYDLKLPA